MEQYQKPEMTIIELEKIDVLTASVTERVECPVCGSKVVKIKSVWKRHITDQHPDYVTANPDFEDRFPG